MNKRLTVAISALVIIMTLVLCSCDEIDSEEMDHMLCRDLILESIPEFRIEDYRAEVWEDGTMETYLAVSMEKYEAESFLKEQAADWPKTPVVTTYKNFSDYIFILPETSFEDIREKLTMLNDKSDVRYIFYDNTSDFMNKYSTQIKEYRSSESKKQAGVIKHEGTFSGLSDPRTPDYALGFVCAFFDPEQNQLYYYKFVPSFDERYTAYLAE